MWHQPFNKPVTLRQIPPLRAVPFLLHNESCCSGGNKAKREKMDLILLISHLSTERESADAMHPQRGQQNEDLLNVLIDINSNKKLQLIC